MNDGTMIRTKGSVPIIYDVTKTKPSHHKNAALAKEQKPTEPTPFEGKQLAASVEASSLPDATKTRLVREIMDYEATHGRCTKTFSKKVRKQLGPPK